MVGDRIMTGHTAGSPARRPSSFVLAGIVLAALLLRGGLAVGIVQHPGIADPGHYYHMGVNLADGRGFIIDYIWQYNRPPDTITHPEDHWMPLAALIAALPLALTGLPVSAAQAADPAAVRAALTGFVLLGAILPALVYACAREMGLSRTAGLLAAGMAAVLPEFVLNSVRTDTTLPAAVLVTAAITGALRGGRTGRLRWDAAAGGLAGIAYLTRTDGVLVLAALIAAGVLSGIVTRRSAPGTARATALRGAVRYGVMIAACTITVAPWLARNIALFGEAGSPETADMFFFTDHLDHYAYGRAFTLETLLAAQSSGQIIGKRVFELAAGAQMMLSTADAAVVPLIGGLALLIGGALRGAWVQHNRVVLRAVLPALLLALGVTLAYALLIPYKAQAGSLKKGWLMALPALLPLAGYALETAIHDRRIRTGAAALICAVLAANAVQLVRVDQRAAIMYRDQIAALAADLRTLPDINGDGERVIMTQDPYIFSHFGVRSVMFPHEPAALVHEIARRYGVDYLLFPPARPALDPLYAAQNAALAAGTAAITGDRLFGYVRGVAGTSYQWWRVE